MIDGLKPYAEYKESGLPWLGQVPRHWVMRRLRASITDCTNGVWGSDPNGKDDLICVRVADFDRVSHRVSLKKKTLRAIPLSARSRRLLRNGDLLLEKSGGGDLQPVGAVVSYDHDEPAVCSNFVARMPVANGYNSHFVVSLHFTLYASRINVLSIKQTTGIQNLDSQAYLREVVAFPPPDEQAAIVRFLDHANRKIDGFIRAKRKLIGLLNEQKQAIIHRAVTRGLHPDVPLKPSGIPWLGDIPKHWEVKRMKFVVDHYGPGIQMGPFGSSLTSLKSQCTGFKLYGQENTISGDFFRGNRWLTREQFDQLRKYEILPGDIVLTRKGSIGKARIVPAGIQKGIADSDTIRVRLDKRHVDPTFVVEVLHTSTYILRQLEMSRRGAVLGGLNTTTIGDILLVLPPLEYQPELLKGLHTAALPLSTAIARTEREIALMQEYRTRLTADLVTGKLDVREAAAKLPEMPTDAAAPAEPLTDEAPEESETEEAEA